MGCQNSYQLQNFVTISGAQKPTWSTFLESEFFLSEKTRLYRYCLNKNQTVHGIIGIPRAMGRG